jgi:hypothetical protein
MERSEERLAHGGELVRHPAGNTFDAGDPVPGPRIDAELTPLPSAPDLESTQLSQQGIDYVAKSCGGSSMVEGTTKLRFRIAAALEAERWARIFV